MNAEERLRAEFGYAFNAKGQLKQVIGDEISEEPFLFDVFEGDHSKNQKRYEEIGILVDEIIYTRLETDCGLERVPVPLDSDGEDNKASDRSFVFITPELTKCEKLLIIVHGSGVVKAGQFARRLIINDGIDIGSQIPFIKRAQNMNFGVLVMNTNFTRVGNRPIEGSSSPHEHARTVWKQLVLPLKQLEHVAILAHSFGGSVSLKLLNDNLEYFERYVFALLLTDAFGEVDSKEKRSELSRYLSAACVNFVSSSKPLNTDLGNTFGLPCRSAGHVQHEWTSISAIDAVFDEIKERLHQRTKK